MTFKLGFDTLTCFSGYVKQPIYSNLKSDSKKLSLNTVVITAALSDIFFESDVK